MSNFYKNCENTGKILKISCVRCHFVKFDISFLGLTQEIFFGVITDNWLHLKPLKSVKKNAILFKPFWDKVFVHWKLQLLNFLMDFVLMFIILLWYCHVDFALALRLLLLALILSNPILS